MASQQQPQLIRGVDAAPIQAQPQHQLEDQVQRALRCAQPLAGVGAQPHTRKDGLDRVAGAQVDPMFFGLCRAPGYAERIDRGSC